MRPGEPLYQASPQGGRGDETRRFFLVIALSLGVVFVYTTFFAPKREAPDPAGEATTEAAGDASADGTASGSPPVFDDDSAAGDDDSAAGGAAGDAAAGAGAEASRRVEPEAHSFAVERPGYSARFENQGGGMSSWVLHGYYQELDLPWLPTWLWDGVKSGLEFERFSLKCPEGVPVEMVPRDHAYHVVPTFGAEGTLVGGPRWEVLEQNDDHVVYRTWHGELEVVASWTIPEDGYLLDYQVEVTNHSVARRSLYPEFSVVQPVPPMKNRYSSNLVPFRERDGKVKHIQIKSVDKKGMFQDREGNIRFGGLGDRYFMTALVPAEPAEAFEAEGLGWGDGTGMGVTDRPPAPDDALVGAWAAGDTHNRIYRATLVFPEQTLEPGETASFDFDLYMGPKVLDQLKGLGLGLENTVQYGVFSILARPMLFLLKLMHKWVGSWGIAIILLTVVVKLLVFPLDQASYKSMRKMRDVGPLMQEIREKYKNDPQRQQTEMMALYKDKGINPLSGCLPMMIQMPIWFALYRVLWNSIELYQVPFLYFCDLTVRDPLCIFPLAIMAVMVIQQKMSPQPATTDPSQQMMMKYMPLFIGFIMFALPSGLVVYILVSSVLRLLQQWFVNRGSDTNDAEAKPDKKSKKK